MSLHDRFKRAGELPMEMREHPRCPHCGTPQTFRSRELVCRVCAPRDVDHDLGVRLATIVAALILVALCVWGAIA